MAVSLTLWVLYPLPKSIVKVLPVGEPPSEKSLPVDNDITSSYYNLVYRLPLGNYDQISGSDGDNKITSVHPMVTGSFAPTGSFLGTGSSTVNFAIINNFTGSSFKSESRVDAIQGPDLGGFVTNDNKCRLVISN